MTATTPPGSPHRPKLAIVGAGVIGKQHGIVSRELAEEMELVAIVDPKPERAEQLGREFGGAAYSSLTDALQQADIDLVAICTPTGTHGELAIEALQAGKHVVIEKPAEVTLAKTDEIIAAAESAGTVVSVISQHRFDPSTELVLDKIVAGELGRLVSGIASIDWYRSQAYYDSGDWRGTWALDGGGALMNQGVHTVDLLVAALGRPVEVVARTATLAHERIEVEDVAAAIVTFESGAIGLIHATTAAYPGMSARLQVHGDRGSAIIDDDGLSFIHTTPADADTSAPAYGAGKKTNQADNYPDAQAAPRAAGADPSQLSDAHTYQYRNILAAIRGEEKVRVGLAENRMSLQVICGVYESARTGRAVQL